MMNQKYTYRFIFLLFLINSLLLNSCKSKKDTEKHLNFSKNVVSVKDDIIDIKPEIIFGKCEIKIVEDVFLVCDRQSVDKGFHLFDKKTFKHIASSGSKGQGPGQIINYQNVKIIPNNLDEKSFLAFDYSQLILYRYNIDSILRNNKYLPEKLLNMNIEQVIGDIAFLNDSIFIGIGSKAVSSSSFIDEVVKFNLNNKKVERFGYEHPKISNLDAKYSHSSFALSKKKDIYIQAYRFQDLMSICNLEGKLLYNIYGSFWKRKSKHKLSFHHGVSIYNDYIITGYVGGDEFVLNKNQQIRGAFPSKFLIFDLKGNYLKTLNIGEEFRNFCIDENNHRLIISFRDREHLLGYINLKEVLKK